MATSRCTSILHPPDNTKANPVVDFSLFRDFSAADSTPSNLYSAREFFLFRFHRRFFRWRASVLKLKPRLRQNAFCRMPAAGNSDTNCWTSARVRRPRRTPFGSPFILPVQHWTCALARCVGQTLTVFSFQTEEWLRCGPDRSCLLKIADRHAKARLAHGVCGIPGHCGPT